MDLWVFFVLFLPFLPFLVIALSFAPEEQKEKINVFCSIKELKSYIKNVMEDYKVTFCEEQRDAEIIFTDKKEEEGKRIAWSPLVIVIGKKMIERYVNEGYIIKNGNAYVIDFDKIMKKTLLGEFGDKIYSNTSYEELFYNFLKIQANDGIYRNEENCEIVEKFLSCKNVIQISSDVLERIRIIRNPEDEIYLVFEKEIYAIPNYCNVEIAYIKNTVLYEVYCLAEENIQNKLSPYLCRIVRKSNYRCEEAPAAVRCKYKVLDEIAYVETTPIRK